MKTWMKKEIKENENREKSSKNEGKRTKNDGNLSKVSVFEE